MGKELFLVLYSTEKYKQLVGISSMFSIYCRFLQQNETCWNIW